KTRKQRRKDAEKAAERTGKPVSYPSPDELRAEAEEEPPAVFVVISDSTGTVVRTLPGPAGEGMHRLTWDLRDPAATLPRPVERGNPADDDEDDFGRGPSGPVVAPGGYTAKLFKRVDGKVTELAGSVAFNVLLDVPGAADP